MPLSVAMKTCKLEGQRCLCVHQESCSCWDGILSTRGQLLPELKTASAGGESQEPSTLCTCPDHPCPRQPRGKISAWSHLLCFNNLTPSPKHRGENPAAGSTVMMGNRMRDCERSPVCFTQWVAWGKARIKDPSLEIAAKPRPTSTGETHIKL